MLEMLCWQWHLYGKICSIVQEILKLNLGLQKAQLKNRSACEIYQVWWCITCSLFSQGMTAPVAKSNRHQMWNVKGGKYPPTTTQSQGSRTFQDTWERPGQNVVIQKQNWRN